MVDRGEGSCVGVRPVPVGKKEAPLGTVLGSVLSTCLCLPALEDQGPDVLVFRPEPF